MHLTPERPQETFSYSSRSRMLPRVRQEMDKPSCALCGAQTQWYGWLHGWLCPACKPEELEEQETENEALEQLQPKERTYLMPKSSYNSLT